VQQLNGCAHLISACRWARRFADAAAFAGTDATLEVWQGLRHVFQLNTGQLIGARRALDHAGAV
jgi:hypothetical protein